MKKTRRSDEKNKCSSWIEIQQSDFFPLIEESNRIHVIVVMSFFYERRRSNLSLVVCDCERYRKDVDGLCKVLNLKPNLNEGSLSAVDAGRMDSEAAALRPTVSEVQVLYYIFNYNCDIKCAVPSGEQTLTAKLSHAKPS
jgi:hypothetical protein